MASRASDDPEERLALATWVKLLRCSETLMASLTPTISRHGLTMAQFTVLEVLLHRGPLPVGEVSRKVLRSHGNICTVVDNLEKSGWVRRSPNPDDRRIVDVELTAEGRRLIERTFADHAREIRQALGALSPAEQHTLGALCRKLGTAQAPPSTR